MFTRILVPLDRSAESEEALDAAVTLALAADAMLELVLVRESQLATELPLPLPPANRHADESYLQSVAHRANLAGLTRIVCTVLDGDPAEAICAEATKVHADLIVMTSHFRTGLARVWTGSVSDSVVRNSGVPVLLIRVVHRTPSAILAPVAFRRILVPLDGSAAAAAVLPSVRALAICDRADVVLLRVLQSPSASTVVLSAPGTISQMGMALSQVDFEVVERVTQRMLSDASEELDSAAAELRAAGVANVSWYVERADDVADGILTFAAVHSIDLIAMTTHGRGMSRLVAGGIADAMLRDSKFPVLLTRPAKDLLDQPEFTSSAVVSQLPGLVTG